MSSAYLGLGSNLGASAEVIERTLAALSRFGSVQARSTLYRTLPVGPPQPDYVNAAALVDTALEPLPLLIGLKTLEHELGRTPGPRWGPRLIDLDILLFDEELIATPGLKVPHPELHRRAFALVPLAEIAPNARHPGLALSVAELLQALPVSEVASVRRLLSAETPR